MKAIITTNQTVTRVQFSIRNIGAAQVQQLRTYIDTALPNTSRILLLDFAKTWTVSTSVLAYIAELSVQHSSYDVACISLPKHAQKHVVKLGLGSIICCFDDLKSATSSQHIKQAQLAEIKTVILATGRNKTLAPLTWQTPVGLIDVLGRTVVERQIDLLYQRGLRQFVINPSYFAPDYPEQLSRHADCQVTCLPEGKWQNKTWVAQPLGTASTLARMSQDVWAFNGDILVVRDDVLFDLDIADLIAAHRKSKADVTVVAPHQALKLPSLEYNKLDIEAVRQFPQLASSFSNLHGIYVVSPRAISAIKDTCGQQIERDLLPQLVHMGCKVEIYAKQFQHHSLHSPQNYYQTLCAGLEGNSLLPMSGIQVRPGVWAAHGAEISSKAKFEGLCYVGPYAQINSGAHIIGPSIIGKGAVVQQKAVMRRSILMNQTQIDKQSWADSMILAPDWAVAHDFADGARVSCDPIAGVHAIGHEKTLKMNKLALQHIPKHQDFAASKAG